MKDSLLSAEFTFAAPVLHSCHGENELPTV